MTEPAPDPAPEPTSPARENINATTTLLAQAADDLAKGRVSAASNNTARAQVHALLAAAMLLAERNAQTAPEPTPEPTPEPPAEEPAP